MHRHFSFFFDSLRLNFLLQSDKKSRNTKLKLNIIFSFFLQGVNIITSLLMVPLTIDFVDINSYGIWLAISTIITWFSFFDLGLGNGLKNRLAEALAIKDYRLARIYISTTYAIITIMMIFVSIIFTISSQFISWSTILNSSTLIESDLATVAKIVFYSFFIRFILQTISTILSADQMPAIARSFNAIANLLSLITIYLLIKFSATGNLIPLSLILSIYPVFILGIGTIILFSKKYKHIKPSFQYIEFNRVKALMGLGIKFFIIQISALILFNSGNYIVIKFYDAEAVAIFNVAFKLFAMISVFFDIIVAPFWATYTEAWIKKEIDWIRRSNKKLLKIWAFSAFAGFLVLISSDSIYAFWIGSRLKVPFSLSLFCYLYFITFTFGGIFNVFINGIGKIQLQWICLLISASLYIPLLYIFVDIFKMGVYSIFLALIILNFYSIIIAPIQFSKLLNGTAKGLMNK